MSDPAGRVLKIGSRGSDLALWQARHVAAAIGVPSEIVIITTSGDRFLAESPTGRLEKGFFTKEIEEALRDLRIDIAVHSLKDLPTAVPAGLTLGAVSAREDVRDLLLVHPDWLDAGRAMPVKAGGKVGATSLRRQSMLRAFAPWLEPVMLRGNVPTRVQKCRRGEYAAVIIAAAGIRRLGLDLTGLMAYQLDPATWLPAPGQGALAIEIREGDEGTRQAVHAIEDADTRACVTIERELLRRFEGGCHEPFGAWARTDGEVRVVTVGHEDSAGRWRAALAVGRDSTALIDSAHDTLLALMKAEPVGERPELVQLCRPLSF